MERSRIRLLRAAAAAVLATGVLGACDGPTDPAQGRSAVPDGPSLLITPACAGGGGQMHQSETITTAQTWTRANSPHRVSGGVQVNQGGRLTIAPGVVVCFGKSAGISTFGGRVIARGRDTAKIVFTAHDPAVGWNGLQFYQTGTSYLTNVVIEHTSIAAAAVHAGGQHALYVDSAVIRRSGRGVVFYSPNAWISRSRVDSTTDRTKPAVLLSGSARFEQTVVRGAAGVGVLAETDGVQLRGGRIEGSGGIGLQILGGLAGTISPIRVVGGGSYGAQMPAHTLARLYPTPALQDSLLGNARDTIIVTGGVLRAQLTAGPRLPLLFTEGVTVADSLGILAAQPGARLVFRPDVRAYFTNGGRLLSRGSAVSPVVFTADDPARGWYGLSLAGAVRGTSYLTNSVVEYVDYTNAAVAARDSQRIVVDSSVIRWSGAGAMLWSRNSRISRTRVDTTLNNSMPAVDLASNALVESTLVRAPAGTGLFIRSPGVVVTGCEVRDGDQMGIEMYHPVTVRNCNLVNNRNGGLINWNFSGAPADVRNNWWGSAGGPGTPGWNGVTGPATYAPWRTAPYVLPYVP